MTLTRKSKNRFVWWWVFLCALLPLLWLLKNILTNNLGPDPADAVVQFTGEWAINLLWLVLAITPLRQLMRWNWLAKYRRMVGLYALFYSTLHILAFFTFILEWNWLRIFEELVERPYIIVGMLAFLILVPLGITSYTPLIRRMGRQWQRLHRLVYVAAVLALIHIIWQVRSDYTEVVVYGVILGTLFAARVINAWLVEDFARSELFEGRRLLKSVRKKSGETD